MLCLLRAFRRLCVDSHQLYRIVQYCTALPLKNSFLNVLEYSGIKWKSIETENVKLVIFFNNGLAQIFYVQLYIAKDHKYSGLFWNISIGKNFSK